MTWCIAHRGEPRGSRENTLPAIAAAVDAGADLVEIDVRVTRDGEAVLLHDATFERLWGDPRAVSLLSLAEVREIGARSGTWSVPTLGEGLDLARELGVTLVVDVTSEPIGIAAEAVVRSREQHDGVVFCGATEALAAIRRRAENVRIALSWGRGPLPDDEIWRTVRPQVFNPEWVALSADVVRRVHADGRKVWTWTVDDPARMAHLLELGVDAIISNEIATLVDLVKRPLTLEPARPADAGPLAALRDEAAAWLHSRGIEQWLPGEFGVEAFAASIDRDDVFVFRAGGLLIGTVTVNQADGLTWPEHDHTAALYVHRLIVRRSHQGRGLGGDLLREVERLARERRCRVVRLDCAETNPALGSYYLRQGYREVGRRESRAETGYPPLRLFEKSVNAASVPEA